MKNKKVEELVNLDEEYLWCHDCDAWRHHQPKRWESSIAIVVDEECVRCRYIFNRKVSKRAEALKEE